MDKATEEVKEKVKSENRYLALSDLSKKELSRIKFVLAVIYNRLECFMKLLINGIIFP